MQNFRLSVDISDVYKEIKPKLTKEYSFPFFFIFLEADNPDDACYTFLNRLLHSIINKEDTLDNRILCRKIKKYIRIYKIVKL